MYEFLYRHLLAHIDPERIHHLSLSLLEQASHLPPALALLERQFSPPSTIPPLKLFGMEFQHPLGLAAGFDKDARCLPALAALGFSFVEVGTVTPQPQPGNPRPRLFRLPQDNALINRMGFPSDGMMAMQQRLGRLQERRVPLFISLGKNKATPLAQAARDYVAVLEGLYGQGDAFVVNISSPNTPELRQLQTRDYLAGLLGALREAVLRLAQDAAPKPLLLKISPDMSWTELDELLELAIRHHISGIIATNTTTARSGLHSPHQTETGGLSGAPLRQRSTEIIRHIHQQAGTQLIIIGVGGVFEGDDLWDKLSAGASLVQAYTGFIYRGPRFVRTTIQQVNTRMRSNGLVRFEEITGINHAT
jgi:dihydroorotate dehydrogenase